MGETQQYLLIRKKQLKNHKLSPCWPQLHPVKKIAGTTHRKKRLEDTELVLEDGGGEKPRPVPSRDQTLNPEDSSYDTVTHGVTASNSKTVLPQTNLRKTRKNPLAWPPHNTAEISPQLQGHPPSRPLPCGPEGSGISSKVLALKSPPPDAINTTSGTDRSLHK